LRADHRLWGEVLTSSPSNRGITTVIGRTSRGTAISAVQARPGGRCDCPDQAQAGHPRLDPRVPESGL